MNRASHAEKRRALIALSSASVLAIVALWIVYMHYMLSSPDGPTDGGMGAIFANGLDVTFETVRTGLVNSYMYFHAVFAEGTTYTVTR